MHSRCELATVFDGVVLVRLAAERRSFQALRWRIILGDVLVVDDVHWVRLRHRNLELLDDLDGERLLDLDCKRENQLRIMLED